MLQNVNPVIMESINPIVNQDLISIKNIQELKLLARRADGCFDVVVLLSLGLRSTKSIMFSEKQDMWYIYNMIDDSEQDLSTQELWTKSIIGEALSKHALYILECDLKEINEAT